MWTLQLAEGWGSKPNYIHSFDIDESTEKHGEYFSIEFNARHWTDKLSWKLEDSSGCRHDLPYFFKRGDLNRFSIIVEGSNGISEYFFTCSLQIWPKEFQMPIAKFYSVSTVRLKLPKSVLNDTRRHKVQAPRIRIRRKGEENWIESSRMVTFNRCDEIFEAQSYYPLPNDDIVHSPTLDISCMWNEYNFEKDCQIDLEEMYLHRKFSLVLDPTTCFKTNFTIALGMIGSHGSTEDHMETEVLSVRGEEQKKTDYFLVPGSRYELKFNVDNLNISYERIFEVPMEHPIDLMLWTSLFGSEDQVTFFRRDADPYPEKMDEITRAREKKEINITTTYINLNRHGVYKCKKTYQQFSNSKLYEKSDYGGTFTLYRLDSKTFRINFSKLFKSKVSTKPDVVLSPLDPTYTVESPAALLFPELLHIIISYGDEKNLLRNRLVCKNWCLSIHPILISGTMTAKSITIFGATYTRK